VSPVVSDLRRLFNDVIRFEVQLRNAVDTRLKSEFDLPLTHFEPMSVMDTTSRPNSVSRLAA
jgi:hypothetical protein